MKQFLDILSGNVPGGIYLYLVLFATLFFIFLYFYKTSELFTRRHFIRWFVGSWVVLTLLYAYVWWHNFPEEYFLKRYSIYVQAHSPEDNLWAYYLRDELSERTAPQKNRWTYFFPQRWFYYARLDCQVDSARCLYVIQTLPIETVLWIQVATNTEGALEAEVVLLENGQDVSERQRFRIDPGNPFATVQKIIEWGKNSFPFRENADLAPLPDPLQIRARDAFYRGEYEQSYRLFRQALSKSGVDTNAHPWYQFAKIRYALVLKARQGWVNPLNKEEQPWQRLNRQARNTLLRILKESNGRYMDNPFYNMMIGESFILDERFHDAEIFLENAYIQAPFDVDILENLSHLHPSRLENLKLKNKYQVWQKALTYCPIYEELLVKYVEFLLNVHPIQGDPPIIARQLMNRYLALNPGSPTIWNLLGKYYLMIRQYSQAVAVFQKADSLNPRNSLTKYNLGVAYYNLRNYTKAESFFRQAIAIDDYLDAHLYLGEIYREQGDCQRALREFRYRVAHKTGPDDAYAYEAMKGIRDCLKKLGMPIPQ